MSLTPIVFVWTCVVLLILVLCHFLNSDTGHIKQRHQKPVDRSPAADEKTMYLKELMETRPC